MFKAVSKYPSIEAKHSKALLKFIFPTKVNEIYRHGYSSKNMSKEAFRFAVNIVEFELQSKDFLHATFSALLFENDTNAHFISFLE